MNSNTVPGIVRIDVAFCSDLSRNLMFHSIAGAVIALATKTVRVSFYGVPSLKWESEPLNGVRNERSTLEFDSSMVLPEGERLAFIVTTASGRQFLIGTREPNYPVITFSESSGSPGGEAAVRHYVVSHLALKSVLPCIL